MTGSPAAGELCELLSRIVAAREEQALGEYEEAAAILADLEAELGGIIRGEAP